MNNTSWYLTLLLVLCNNSFGMDQQTDATVQHRDAFYRVLPQLTTNVQRPFPKYGMHSGTSYLDALHEVKFKSAFLGEDVNGALEELAKPVALLRQDIKDGKVITRKSLYRDARSLYALGALAMEDGNKEEAIEFFKATERAVLYKPHEVPYEHAASFARFMLEGQHCLAYDQLQALQKLVSYYPSFKDLAHLERTMLVDVHYMPLLEQLAQEGSVDAQYRLLQEACKRAVLEKTLDSQSAQFERCQKYFTALDVHPEFRPLVEAVSVYMQGVEACKRTYDQETITNLLGLLTQSSQDNSLVQVKQLAHAVLERIGQNGALRARAYLVAQDLKNSDKRERTKGLQAIVAILHEQRASETDAVKHAFAEFGIQDLVAGMVKNNNTLACCIWAHLTSIELLRRMTSFLLAPDAKMAFEDLKKCAQTGNTQTCIEKELMQAISSFADIIDSYHQGNLALVIKKCGELLVANRQESYVERLIGERAKDLLEHLARDGQLDACIWNVQERIKKDGDALTAETAAYCCEIATRFLEASADVFTQKDKCQCISDALTKLSTQQNDPKAKYLLSRLLFRLAYTGQEQQNIPVAQRDLLEQSFKNAMLAFKGGIKEAEPFCKALVLYRGILSFIDQKKYTEAVDKFIELESLSLPVQERDLLIRFVEYGMGLATGAGDIRAINWGARLFLSSSSSIQGYQRALHLTTTLCIECLKFDYDTEPIATWERILSVFKEPTTLTRIFSLNGADYSLRAQTQLAFIKCMIHMVHVLTPCKLLSDQTDTQEAHLQTAVQYAQQAYDLSCAHKELADLQRLCKATLSSAYFYLSRYLLYEDREEESEAALEKGAQLDHPNCMRAIVLNAVDVPRKLKPMSKQEFEAHMKRLLRAYNMGDSYAGVILAQHYFDGSERTFACGYSLGQDRKTAYYLAQKLKEFKETKRILAQEELDKASNDRAHEEMHVRNAVTLLQEAVSAGCEESCAQLARLIDSPLCSSAQVEEIYEFIKQKAKVKLPSALRALGTLHARYPESTAQAIECFKEAIELSDGKHGVYELLEIFCKTPEVHLCGNNLFFAADLCLLLVHDITHLENIESHGLPFVLQVLPLLDLVDADADYKTEAATHYDELVVALRTLGIVASTEVVKKEEETEEMKKWRVLNGGEFQNEQGACVTFRTLVKEPTLATEEFLKNLCLIDVVFEDMASEKAQAICKDALLMRTLDAAAAQGSAQAQFLLSKMLSYEAEHDKALQADRESKRRHLQQALKCSGEAATSEPEQARHVAQFERNFESLFLFDQTIYIPYVQGNREALAVVFHELQPTLEHTNAGTIPGINSDKLRSLALQSVRILAFNGCVPALDNFVEKNLLSKNKKEMNDALEAIIRCMSFHELTLSDLQASGFYDVITKHIEYIKRLADTTNNGRAACIMMLWCSAHYGGADASNEDLAAVMSYGDKAKDSGYSTGIYHWWKDRLYCNAQMSDQMFSAALKALEGIAEQEAAAGELLLRLYGGSTLPCGKEVIPDRKRSKKLALSLKDRSTCALKRLVSFAREDGDFKKAIAYKFELIQRTHNASDDLYLELSQLCAGGYMYPDDLILFLEHKAKNGHIAAMQALGGLKAVQKKYDEAIKLFDRVIADGGRLSALAHLEMAFVHISKDSNVLKALEHIERGIEATVAKQFSKDIAIGTVQTFGMRLIKFMLDCLLTQKLEQREQANKVFEQLIDCMKQHNFYQSHSVEWRLMIATMHCINGSDYPLLLQHYEPLFLLLTNVKNMKSYCGFIGNAISLVVSRLHEDAQACKTTNPQRSHDIIKAVSKITHSLQKANIQYYMVVPEATFQKSITGAK
ncbi:MAG: tetratricopeptide repeat protein [Candidatus Babeliales bacterium]